MGKSAKKTAVETTTTLPLEQRKRSATAEPADRNWRGVFNRLFSKFRSGKPNDGSKKDNSNAIDQSGRYLDANEINRGGMGIIYQVLDKSLERPSAMKVALPATIQDRESAAIFVREACLTAQLEHPNIVPVHDLGKTPGGAVYYTMKLVDGEPLNRVLEQIRKGNAEYRRRYDLFERLTIFLKVCHAMAFAHARQIIHRDIKPENIMVGAYGEVLLMDWGLAKIIGTPDEETPAGTAAPADSVVSLARQYSTTSGMIKGTPAYMAPEQAAGHTDEVDFQTDIFLLGATLFHIVTLRPPYVGRTADEVIARAVLGTIPNPAAVAPGEQLPEELCRIISKAMAAQKADRYATVDELSDDLSALLAGRTPSRCTIFKPGDYLMRAGEKGREGYVILSGRVEVIRETDGTRMPLGVLGPGDVVGEMALLTDEVRSASVVAIMDTEVEIITAEVMKTELKKLSPWMGKVINALAQRLRTANALLHPLLMGDCAYQVAKQILLICRHCPVGQTDGRVSLPEYRREELIAMVSCNLALPPDRVGTALDQLLACDLIKFREDRQVDGRNLQALETFITTMENSRLK